MWSSSTSYANAVRLTYVSAVMTLAACTVEPLNARNTPASISNESQSVRAALKATEVEAATTRVEQQIRNKLLFALNGGQDSSDPLYRVFIRATARDSGVAVERGVAAAIAAQVTVTARYSIVEKKTGQTLASGSRIGLASYNRTPQLFANQRAERDAEDRAAKDVAQQIRLVIAQTLAGR